MRVVFKSFGGWNFHPDIRVFEKDKDGDSRELDGAYRGASQGRRIGIEDSD